MGKGVFAAVAVGLATLAAAGVAGGSTPVVHPALSAKLTGAAESPNGSPRGFGAALIKLHSATSKVCWRLTVRRLDKPLSAHIHKGRPGKNGRVVVPLGARFATRGCVRVPKETLLAVGRNPRAYYVNVHTKKYIDGAIRGQLKVRR